MMHVKAGTSLRNAPVRLYVLASLFAGLTAVGAFIRIPLPIVPFTLQDFFVLLSGSVLGPAFGFLSQMLYLTMGLIGLPVFANGGGPAYIFQPTFGYLLAFPLCSYLIGYLLYRKGAKTELTFSTVLIVNLLGYLVIYSLGILILYVNLNYVVGQSRLFSEVLWLGCFIFIPGSLIKATISAFVTLKLTNVLNRL